MTYTSPHRPDLAPRVALRVIRPSTDRGTNALVALPDGTIIAGVMSLSIDQGAVGQAPILTLKIFDFDVEIQGTTNRRRALVGNPEKL